MIFLQADSNPNAGGFGLLLQNSIKYEFIGLNLDISGCEILCVKLRHALNNLIVGVTY